MSDTGLFYSHIFHHSHYSHVVKHILGLGQTRARGAQTVKEAWRLDRTRLLMSRANVALDCRQNDSRTRRPPGRRWPCQSACSPKLDAWHVARRLPATIPPPPRLTSVSRYEIELAGVCLA
jgi:hypothetical protein